MKWFPKAADQGEPVAQLDLGLMYYMGESVPRDYVRAYMWYNLSAAQGNKAAIKSRQMLEFSMSHEQIAEAQRLAREWSPTKN